MNRISLKNMKIFGFTGCLPEENENGQYFYVTVDIFCKDNKGVISDELDDTVNYAEVYDRVVRIVSRKDISLIEHLAYVIGRDVISCNTIIDSVKVTVSKPDAPIDGEFDSMEVEVTVRRRDAVIGFGGNMGDREDLIKSALKSLNANPSIDVIKVSSIYETEPVGYEDQADFLNGCALVRTYLEPYELLHELQKIENDLNRVRTIRNGPRTIDLDLLLMQGIKLNTEELTVPHPRMYERAFVLVPLKELGLYNGDIPDGKSVRLYGTISVD